VFKEDTFSNLILRQKGLIKDPKIPDEDEMKRLREIYNYLRTSEIKMLFMLYPTLILILMTYFLDKYPVAIFSIVMYALIMLTGILYLMVKRELLKRCPRCSRRGIPPASFDPVNSNCPRCQMYLDPAYENNKG
jgi:hypothetical protein